jgi:hypothetical protein
MATPEQVEAVARAIVNTDDQMDCLWGDDPGIDENAVRVATAAIAAYEATKPVVSDRELWLAFWSEAEIVDGDSESIMTGIRAVRARLEGGDDG